MDMMMVDLGNEDDEDNDIGSKGKNFLFIQTLVGIFIISSLVFNNLYIQPFMSWQLLLVQVNDEAVLWGPDSDDPENAGLVRLQDLASTLKTTQSALTCGLDLVRVKRVLVES